MHRIVEHTADVGIYAEGKSKRECMEELGKGLMKLMGGEEKEVEFKHEFSVPLDFPERIVELFSDILWFVETNHVTPVPSSFVVKEINDHLTIELGFIRKPAKNEVKAITLYSFFLKEENGIWKSRVIVDI